MDAEFERDPAFRDYINRKGIEALAMRTLEARRPTGVIAKTARPEGRRVSQCKKNEEPTSL
jgi:hypothetical protein